MSGYAASARIARATPRVAPPPRMGAELEPEPVRAWTAATVVEGGVAITREVPDLAETWAAIRERWSQLTFYLFDAESWR